MEKRVVIRREVEIRPGEVVIRFNINGNLYSETVAKEVAEIYGIPYLKAYEKIDKAFKEFKETIKERYHVDIDGMRVWFHEFKTISDVKEFIKFTTKAYEHTIVKAIRELKTEETLNDLKTWLIEDYKIKI